MIIHQEPLVFQLEYVFVVVYSLCVWGLEYTLKSTLNNENM